MSNKKYMYSFVALAVFLTLAMAVPAFAEDNGSGGQSNGININGGLNLGMHKGDNENGQDSNRGGVMRFGVFGTVSAVSGNTITVSGKQGPGFNATAVTTFTVDATNAKIVKNGVAGTVSSIAVGDTVMVQGAVTGTNIVATMIRDGQAMMNRGKQGLSGVVSAVSGNTITITSNKGHDNNNNTATTFTIDATNATIVKNGVAGTVASIAVGDKIMAQGTLTGTNLVAIMIRDGQQANKGDNKSGQVPSIVGNGQPIVAGTVSSVSGVTITITNKSNVTYTIDATNAKIVKGSNTALVSDVAVGDVVIAQGAINGNAVVATTVIDQTKPIDTKGEGEAHGGFFSGVGSFFSHLFGF